jgi:hypothetical protein
MLWRELLISLAFYNRLSSTLKSPLCRLFRLKNAMINAITKNSE